jgi:hypothetical protein
MANWRLLRLMLDEIRVEFRTWAALPRTLNWTMIRRIGVALRRAPLVPRKRTPPRERNAVDGALASAAVRPQKTMSRVPHALESIDIKSPPDGARDRHETHLARVGDANSLILVPDDCPAGSLHPTEIQHDPPFYLPDCRIARDRSRLTNVVVLVFGKLDLGSQVGCSSAAERLWASPEEHQRIYESQVLPAKRDDHGQMPPLMLGGAACEGSPRRPRVLGQASNSRVGQGMANPGFAFHIARVSVRRGPPNGTECRRIWPGPIWIPDPKVDLLDSAAVWS